MADQEHQGYGGRRLRTGDEERDEVVSELRAHHEAGRLTAEEFDERMTTALSATYRDELPPLLDDLPRIGQPQGTPEPARREPRFVSMARRGPWIPLLPVLVVLVAMASIGAVANGVFPWPLFWLGVLFTWLHLRRRGRSGPGRAPWGSAPGRTWGPPWRQQWGGGPWGPRRGYGPRWGDRDPRWDDRDDARPGQEPTRAA